MIAVPLNITGGLTAEDLADLELAKKKQNVLLKQLLAMPGQNLTREQIAAQMQLAAERRTSTEVWLNIMYLR